MPTYRTRAFGYNLYYGSYCSGYYWKRKGLKISDDMKVSEQNVVLQFQRVTYYWVD